MRSVIFSQICLLLLLLILLWQHAMKEMGLDWKEAKSVVENRTNWRMF